MNKKTRKFLVATSFALAALLASALALTAQSSDSVTICNHTGTDIYKVCLSPPDGVGWCFDSNPSRTVLLQ